MAELTTDAKLPRLGAESVRGAAWMVSLSAVGKIVALVCQVALAWFLVPEDFGLVAVALAIANFTRVISAGSLQDVLVQRQASFARDASQVFWLAFALHALIAIVLALVSPAAAHLFQSPQLPLFIIVLAVSFILFSLATIHLAALKIHLQFRTLAAINFFRGLIRSAFMVIMAALGFGSFSLVVPFVFSALFVAGAARVSAGRIPIRRPRPRLWTSWLGAGIWLSLSSLFTSLIISGTSFVVGLVHQPAVTGLYFWGFNLSAQSILLLSNNLRVVFFSTLAKLNQEPDRQYRAVWSGSQMMTAITAPVCFLQAFLARPLIGLLFQERWLDAAPVVEWLSVAMLTQPLYLMTTSLLMARGLNRTLAVLTGLTATTAGLAAGAGALAGDATEIARYVGTGLFFAQLAAGWVAFRLLGRGWKELVLAIGPPLALLLPAALVAISFSACGPLWDEIWWLLVRGATGVLLYAVLIRMFLPNVARALLTRLRTDRLLGRGRSSQDLQDAGGMQNQRHQK